MLNSTDLRALLVNIIRAERVYGDRGYPEALREEYTAYAELSAKVLADHYAQAAQGDAEKAVRMYIDGINEVRATYEPLSFRD